MILQSRIHCEQKECENYMVIGGCLEVCKLKDVDTENDCPEQIREIIENDDDFAVYRIVDTDLLNAAELGLEYLKHTTHECEIIGPPGMDGCWQCHQDNENRKMIEGAIAKAREGVSDE